MSRVHNMAMHGAYSAQIGSLGYSGPHFRLLHFSKVGSENLGWWFTVEKANETSTQQRGNSVAGI
jgi:hypothetical protein